MYLYIVVGSGSYEIVLQYSTIVTINYFIFSAENDGTHTPKTISLYTDNTYATLYQQWNVLFTSTNIINGNSVSSMILILDIPLYMQNCYFKITSTTQYQVMVYSLQAYYGNNVPTTLSPAALLGGYYIKPTSCVDPLNYPVNVGGSASNICTDTLYNPLLPW